MNIHQDISIITNCIETVLKNINTPNNVPTFTFEIYRSSSDSNVLLIRTGYPEPFPMIYEGFDIAEMVSNLYDGHGKYGNKERTNHKCRALLRFKPEHRKASTKSIRSESLSATIRKEECQLHVNVYNRKCNEIANNCTKIAVITCSRTANISMNPLLWFDDVNNNQRIDMF